MAKPPVPAGDSVATETQTDPVIEQPRGGLGDWDGDGHAGGAASAPATQTFLTSRHSDRYGPGGRFIDLSAEDAAAGLERGQPCAEFPEGEEPELTVPTEDQMSRRRPAP